jgi:hypothetical protein
MPARRIAGKLRAMTSPRTLISVLAALLALDALGFGVALATGIVDPLPGFLNGSKTHAPLVIWAVQALGVWLLLARASRAGGGLALLACTVSLAAVAFDGDLAHAGLGPGHIALQVAVAALTAVLWALLAARVRSAGRCVASSPSSPSSPPSPAR